MALWFVRGVRSAKKKWPAHWGGRLTGGIRYISCPFFPLCVALILSIQIANLRRRWETKRQSFRRALLTGVPHS
jgi:hypothetical protein